MFGNYRRLLFYALAAVALAGLIFLLGDQVLARRPFPSGTRVIVKTVYDLCGHEVVDREGTPAELGALTPRELRYLYPRREGWQVEVKDRGVTVLRSLEELCEKCSRLTHLGEKGGFVAVIRGPAGVDGGVIRVTKTRVDSLPSELRRKAKDGILDLPDEETLLQILDSLEEESG
ncbi:MAG: Putative membrane protein [Thermacetogenium phaeum]|uniref:Putative membrane protein n=1 Tax=Thermacetogenium phaeum TaxID=85874 RepID=A0A101FGP6_9THEO|nr:MAG: Putative membrane protein [Thermacetogenium phaeum]